MPRCAVFQETLMVMTSLFTQLTQLSQAWHHSKGWQLTYHRSRRWPCTPWRRWAWERSWRSTSPWSAARRCHPGRCWANPAGTPPHRSPPSPASSCCAAALGTRQSAHSTSSQTFQTGTEDGVCVHHCQRRGMRGILFTSCGKGKKLG